MDSIYNISIISPQFSSKYYCIVANNNNMSYHSIQQQVSQLFDRAEHENISHFEDTDYQPLVNLPVSAELSITIMKDVIQAIIYVASQLLIYKPCQVFKQHIIKKKNGRWGLRNIICYRDPREDQQFNSNNYYPIDYFEHPNEESELIWSLGRTWFEILTNKKIPSLNSLTQQSIDKILLKSGINNSDILKYLKKILVKDSDDRMTFANFMDCELFKSDLKSNLYLHSKFMLNDPSVQVFNANMKSIFLKQGSLNDSPSYNPFEQQIFKRDFKESLIVANLFSKVQQFITSKFESEDKQYEAQVSFSCYLLNLVTYYRLNSFKVKRQQNLFNIVFLYDKEDYTKFLERLVGLEDKLNHDRKKKKYSELRKKYPKLLENPSNISKKDFEDEVYPHFKRYLITYAKCYKEQVITKNVDCESFIPYIQLLLVRSTNYVFNNCRKFVFEDFISEKKDSHAKFNLKNVLENIENCKDLSRLQSLEKKIIDLYFSPNQTH